MLKFFRKIRLKLLGQGRFSQYLKYAFGEILLVMIGILLALQINNWNQGRLEQEKEVVLVKDLDEELYENQRYIQGRIRYLTERVEKRIIDLIKLTGPSPAVISTDSISPLLLNVIYQAPYTPVIAKYEHIMSSDDNSLIRYDTLKQMLFQYKVALDKTFYEQFEMRDNIIQYLQSNYSTLHMLNQQGLGTFNNLKKEDYTDNYFPIDVMALLSDRTFQSMLVTRAEANGFTLMLLKNLLLHIEEMRGFIQRNYPI